MIIVIVEERTDIDAIGGGTYPTNRCNPIEHYRQSFTRLDLPSLIGFLNGLGKKGGDVVPPTQLPTGLDGN